LVPAELNVNTLAHKVCVTEMAFGGALEHLEHNVELNRAKLAAPLSQLTAADCDWSLWTQSAAGDGGGGEGGAAQAEDPSAAGWDLVIGSDLVYNDAGIKSLPLVLAGLLRRRGCACAPVPHLRPSALCPRDPCACAAPEPPPPLSHRRLYAHTLHRFEMADQAPRRAPGTPPAPRPASRRRRAAPRRTSSPTSRPPASRRPRPAPPAAPRRAAANPRTSPSRTKASRAQKLLAHKSFSRTKASRGLTWGASPGP